MVVHSISAKYSYSITYTFCVPVFTSARTPCPRLRRAADGGATMGPRVSEMRPVCRSPPSLLPFPRFFPFVFSCEVLLLFFRYHIDHIVGEESRGRNGRIGIFDDSTLN